MLSGAVGVPAPPPPRGRTPPRTPSPARALRTTPRTRMSTLSTYRATRRPRPLPTPQQHSRGYQNIGSSSHSHVFTQRHSKSLVQPGSTWGARAAAARRGGARFTRQRGSYYTGLVAELPARALYYALVLSSLLIVISLTTTR